MWRVPCTIAMVLAMLPLTQAQDAALTFEFDSKVGLPEALDRLRARTLPKQHLRGRLYVARRGKIFAVAKEIRELSRDGGKTWVPNPYTIIDYLSDDGTLVMISRDRKKKVGLQRGRVQDLAWGVHDFNGTLGWVVPEAIFLNKPVRFPDLSTSVVGGFTRLKWTLGDVNGNRFGFILDQRMPPPGYLRFAAEAPRREVLCKHDPAGNLVDARDVFPNGEITYRRIPDEEPPPWFLKSLPSMGLRPFSDAPPGVEVVATRLPTAPLADTVDPATKKPELEWLPMAAAGAAITALGMAAALHFRRRK